MDDAEAVGDEGVAEGGELAGEGEPLLVGLRGLARVEAQVLEHGDLAVAERGDGLLRGGADGVGREGDLLAEQLAEAAHDRAEGVLLLGLALGAAEVGDHRDPGTGLDEPGEGGQRGADAAVVGDRGAVQRHVEIGADEHALAAQLSERIDGLQHCGAPSGVRPRDAGAARRDGGRAEPAGRRPLGVATGGLRGCPGRQRDDARIRGTCRPAARARRGGWRSPTRCRTRRRS